jgi:hypothetical protein
VCCVVAEALVACGNTLTVGLVGLKTGESITFKRKRRLKLQCPGWVVVVEILRFSVDRELGESDRGPYLGTCPRCKSLPRSARRLTESGR